MMRVVRASFDLTVALASMCAVFSSIWATWTQAAQETELFDSRVWASAVTRVPSAWIDSRRVLFLTGADFKQNEYIRALATWEIGGAVRIHRSNVNEYCLRGGSVTYKVVDVERGNLVDGTWFAGKFGEEQPVREDVKGNDARIYDRINCKVSTTKAAAAAQSDRRRIDLLDGHGYLDLGPARGAEANVNVPVRLVNLNRSVERDLPFGGKEIFPFPTYYEFAGAYLIGSIYLEAATGIGKSPWPKGVPQPVWVLSPDGKVSQQAIPKGPWTGLDDPLPYLSKAGLILVRHGGIYDKTDGIYLSAGGTVKHLLPGRVAALGVSPDGCWIAFSHAPSHAQDRADAKNRRTFKAIHLCKRRHRLISRAEQRSRPQPRTVEEEAS